jgi:hypothetical protein
MLEKEFTKKKERNKDCRIERKTEGKGMRIKDQKKEKTRSKR